MKVLALDPSVNNVGWSTFTVPKRKDSRFTRLKAWKWGTWQPEGGSLEMRMMDLCHTIDREIDGFDYLITERPAFYNNERGTIAARLNYTIDLGSINFFVAGWFHMDHRRHFSITATQWKGSVDKVITLRHFFRCFGEKHKNLTDHAVDATMLLRFWLQSYAIASPLVAQHISPEWLRELV